MAAGVLQHDLIEQIAQYIERSADFFRFLYAVPLSLLPDSLVCYVKLADFYDWDRLWPQLDMFFTRDRYFRGCIPHLLSVCSCVKMVPAQIDLLPLLNKSTCIDLGMVLVPTALEWMNVYANVTRVDIRLVHWKLTSRHFDDWCTLIAGLQTLQEIDLSIDYADTWGLWLSPLLPQMLSAVTSSSATRLSFSSDGEVVLDGEACAILLSWIRDRPVTHFSVKNVKIVEIYELMQVIFASKTLVSVSLNFDMPILYDYPSDCLPDQLAAFHGLPCTYDVLTPLTLLLPNSHLESLSFDFTIGFEFFEQVNHLLIACLPSMRSLRSLTIVHYPLTLSTYQVIAMLLPNLTDLVLDDTDIHADGVDMLCSGLQGSSRLRKLSLCQQNLCDDDVAAIAASVPTSIEVLKLSCNNFGLNGVIALSIKLLPMLYLQVLFLHANPLGITGAMTILEAMAEVDFRYKCYINISDTVDTQQERTDLRNFVRAGAFKFQIIMNHG